MDVQLADHGTVFSTRPRGAEIRDALCAQLGARETVRISLDGVGSMSYSFADEFVGGLVERLGPDRVVIEDASPRLLRIIEGSLRRRGLGRRERQLVA